MNYFKYPSQVSFYKHIELIITLIVLYFAKDPLIWIARKLNLNEDGIWVFDTYMLIVTMVMSVLAFVVLVLDIPRYIIMQKNKEVITTLGVVVREHIVVKGKPRKSLTIHMDAKHGLAHMKKLSSVRAAFYMQKEFHAVLKEIQTNPKYQDYDVVRGISARVRPSFFKRKYGVEVNKFKPIQPKIEIFVVNMRHYRKNEKGWFWRCIKDARTVHEFCITKEELQNMIL